MPERKAMPARRWPLWQQLCLVPPLALLFSSLHYGLAEAALRPVNLACFALPVLLLLLFLRSYAYWRDGLIRHDYAGWQRLAAGGKWRYLLLYGMPLRGWSLAVFMLMLDLAAGKPLTLQRLLISLAVWSAAGLFLAHDEWQRLQGEAAQAAGHNESLLKQ